MPFDSAPEMQPLTGREKLARLAKALRCKLPAGFEWDFDDYESCAVAIGARVGLLTRSAMFNRHTLGIELEIDETTQYELFVENNRRRQPKPTAIALRIERHLAKTAA